MKKHRVHFYTVLEYLSRFSFILIIPLIQQIIFLSYNIIEIVRTLSVNIVVVISLISLCVFEYRSHLYRAGKGYFYLKKGIFIKKTLLMPYRCIHSIEIKRNLIRSFFGAARLSLDTPSRQKSSTDIKLTLSYKALENTVKSIFPLKELSLIYKAKKFKIFMTCISWSNPATSLLLSVPFINKMGKILSSEISDRIYSTVNIGIKFLAVGIPPLAAGLAYLILFGWMMGFFVQLVRYYNFKLFKNNDDIIIKRGFINKTEQIINITNINAISVKQTLIMKILKLYTTYINIIGIGKEKGEQRMLIAASSKKELNLYLGNLLSLELVSKKDVFPPKKAFLSYIRTPLIFIFILFIGFFILFLFFSVYIKVAMFLTMFIFIFLLWWLAIRILGYKSSGISIYKGSILVSGYRHLSLITSIISLKKVQFISIKQNPFQYFSGLATVKVYFFSEQADYFKVKQIPLKDIEKLVLKAYLFKKR